MKVFPGTHDKLGSYAARFVHGVCLEFPPPPPHPLPLPASLVSPFSVCPILPTSLIPSISSFLSACLPLTLPYSIPVSLPTYVPSCLHVRQAACPPPCLPSSLRIPACPACQPSLLHPCLLPYQPLPSCLHVCQAVCPPPCLPSSLRIPTCPACQLTLIHPCLPSSLPACFPAYLLPLP